ncbi:long-chain-fatty-acid--CoA ligase [Actinoalloteichus spitiensis]|uniref:long-chain-fatty-acid--CoA ligase n=1 Tax=Actinoalloteichus spitiensis TaxID=252394 RepID=UPI0003816181|nr:long-chain fatty acid--CoA ligase [Actinoalloteichus spitiensis]
MTNLATMLAETATRHPDRPAVRLDEEVLTYRDLLHRASDVALTLAARDVRPGDRVGFVLPNVPAFPVVFFGVLLAGGVAVPMAPLLRSREIRYRLADAETSLVVSDGPAMDQVTPAAGEVGVPALTVAELADTPGLLAPTPEGEVAELVERAGAIDPAATALILYTSGTTGEPKGAELTHDNLRGNAELTATTVLECAEDDVIMGCLPLFHSFGLTCGLLAAVRTGACLTLVPRFDPGRALEVVERDRVTVFEGVPTMYGAMLNHPDRHGVDVSSLRTCISGGAAMPLELLSAFESAFGCQILEGYGLSETSPVASFNHPNRPRKAGSIGTPVRGVRMRVVDDLGAELPDGEIGEIVIQGPNVMRGYWRRPEATAEAMPDGWLRTGDLARRDEDGFFHIVDRKKDLILRGGYNVYPREVEEACYEHPDVLEVAVVGVPHPELGEEVGAAVARKPGATVTEDELRGFLRERVATYKYPRHVWFVPELPKGLTGKILRRAVRLPED